MRQEIRICKTHCCFGCCGLAGRHQCPRASTGALLTHYTPLRHCLAQAWICLRRDTFPRKQCIGIISNKWFDRIILSLIGINCVTMALFASPLIKNMLEGECDGEDTFSKPVHGFTTCTDLINSRSQWAVQHWTFGVLKPQKGCSLNDAAPCSIAQTIDFFFLIVFTIEMLIKMLAQGLLMHKNAYLRQGWNWLDFVVVIVGYVEMFASALPGIKAIRLVKALRPLRSLQRIRGLRVLVQCILEALPQMLNVAVFLIFMIVIFGLFGHAFFKGTLRHTCHACDQWNSDYTVCLGEWSSTGDTCDAECSWDEDANGIKLKKCDALGNGTWQMEMGKWPGKWTYSCRARERCLCTSMDKSNVRVEPKWGKASTTTDVRMQVETGAGWSDGITFSSAAEDTKNRKPWIKSGASVYGYPVAAVDAAACDYLSNPNYGITSFDSLPWAMVSLFQAISLEGWVDMMYQLMDGYGMWVVIYFILLVLVGAIIVMNLFLAVLCDNFEMADDAATEDGLPEEPIEDAEEVMEREMKLLAHENKYRQMCLELIKIKRFDMFIQVGRACPPSSPPRPLRAFALVPALTCVARSCLRAILPSRAPAYLRSRGSIGCAPSLLSACRGASSSIPCSCASSGPRGQRTISRLPSRATRPGATSRHGTVC